METKLNVQRINQTNQTPQTNRQMNFLSSKTGLDATEFGAKKQSNERIITFASVGTAIATTVGLICSRKQLHKIEQKMNKYLDSIGEKVTLDETIKPKNLINKLNKVGLSVKNAFTGTYNRVNNKVDTFFNLAAKDTLTGMYNRRYLYSNLSKIVDEAKVKKDGTVVAMMDLDYFKSINTAFEHKGGDEFLKRISTIIKDVFNKEGELVARYGGEEIVIITKDPEKLKLLSEKINTDAELLKKKDAYIEIFKKLLSSKNTNSADKAIFPDYINHVTKKKGFTTSIGYIKVDNNLDINPEDYVKVADTSLEKLKKSGHRGEIKEATNKDIKSLYMEKIQELKEQNVKNYNAETKKKIEMLQDKIRQL